MLQERHIRHVWLWDETPLRFKIEMSELFKSNCQSPSRYVCPRRSHLFGTLEMTFTVQLKTTSPREWDAFFRGGNVGLNRASEAFFGGGRGA
jgi:hypothetical protein